MEYLILYELSDPDVAVNSSGKRPAQMPANVGVVAADVSVPEQAIITAWRELGNY
jgi:hypothetical protein